MSIILSFIIIENVINSLTFTNVVNYIFYQNKQYMKLVNFLDSKFAAPLQYWGFLVLGSPFTKISVVKCGESLRTNPMSK